MYKVFRIKTSASMGAPSPLDTNSKSFFFFSVFCHFSFRELMSNTSEPSRGQQFCPLLLSMMTHSHNNTETNTMLVCFHGLVSCLGIMENALILWVVGFRLQRRTVTSVWVLNLAMSDFLTTLTLPLFTMYLQAKHSWDLGNGLCKAQASIFFVNMFVSAFLLAAISVDRCLLVAKPVWSQNHRSVAGAWKVCALGWLWAAINTLPYFVFRAVNTAGGRKLCYHHFAMYPSSQDSLKRDCEVRQAATAISKSLLAFLFPLVVIAGSYIHIAVSLWNRSKRRKQSDTIVPNALIESNKDGESGTANTPQTTKTTNISLKPRAPSLSVFKSTPSLSPTTCNQPSQSLLSQSFTKMVTFVIAAFALCWAPYHIFCILEVAAHYNFNLLNKVEVGLPMATTFAFLNSVLNPILYVFSCPNFSVRIRQSLGAVFDVLVDERALMMSPRRTVIAQIKRRCSRDLGLETQKLSCSTPVPRQESKTEEELEC
ncbi:prostaglandin D2 receptor 2 [Acanthopagrus latus]|uniref:prostaglandin D2 receptor 2 n=1 Tax=Acanthopagrus latus TaxID=8177 RepID=UPI00187C37CD|nr:prostaglandin D2 receptor 2 [Acanthopagrus latus]